MGTIDIPATHRSERNLNLGQVQPPPRKKSAQVTPSMYRSASRISSRASGGSLDSAAEILARADVEVAFVNKLDTKHECPVCCQVLRYPVQFEECGHRCCSSCLPELLRSV